MLFILSILLFPALGLDSAMSNVLAIAILMVFWWITETVPIYMTALLPMVLFPLLGIMSIQETTVNYGNNVIFLFFGGFLLAKALEKWNLHRRIALSILNITGTGPRKIILGTLLATATLSMWISNTATAMMMLPIALSVVNLFLQESPGMAQDKNTRNFATVMMLAVAYGANIGGIATLIGTPPNTVMAGIMENTFNYQVGFSNWMLLGLPFSILLLLGSYFLLVYVMLPVKSRDVNFSRDVIRSELAKLGKMTPAEKRVLAIFSLTAFCWIFRQQMETLFPALNGLSDTQIAIFGGFLMYIVPAGAGAESKVLLDWNDAQNIPWGILLLFGGGLALAAAMETTGILEQTAAYFSGQPVKPGMLMVLMIGAASVFLSELMSNTALATIMVPLAGSIAAGLGMHPLELAAPVTIAASAAFMLPMGTPPNAIVFASGHISIRQMVKAGFFLNLLGILLVTLFAKFVIPYCFDL